MATEDRDVIRDGIVVGLATGAYGLSFGALSDAAGLSLVQTCTLSLLVFTGASQFALVAVIGGGGAPMTGAATAILLGVRHALYGLRLSRILNLRGWRRAGAAQLVIDESSAMSFRDDDHQSRLGFWWTGVAVFIFWNLATLIGALGAQTLSDPTVLGLDAAAPAAFVALLAPRMRSRQTWILAVLAGVVAIVAVPFVPAGVPVLVAAGTAALVTWRMQPSEPVGVETTDAEALPDSDGIQSDPTSEAP
jgi:predicted branched-subunit amino acid permease